MNNTTLETLRSTYPHLTGEWHQHLNGNGWVYETASVEESAYVGPDAQIYDNAQIFENARIYGSAQIYGDAWISDNAQISIGEITDGEWTRTPLFIAGSKHGLSHTAPGMIKIGCHILSITEWQDQYKAIGRLEKYTDSEIEEYARYIELFAIVDAELFPVVTEA